mgnify:CR=1 FL=1
MPPVKLKSLFVAATITIGAVATTSSVLPQAVSAGPPAVSGVAVGLDHACVIKGGGLLCWGRNQYGQLGDGTTINRPNPTDVTGMLSGVTAVVAGDNHTCAIKAGTATCWGANNAGQLGAGSFTASVVAAGGDNTCAINSGALTCWGANGGGQLGNGTTDRKSTRLNSSHT